MLITFTFVYATSVIFMCFWFHTYTCDVNTNLIIIINFYDDNDGKIYANTLFLTV